MQVVGQQPPQPPQSPVVAGPAPGQAVGQGPGGPGPIVVRSGSPNAIYDAFRHQRRELNDQLDRLENQRENIAEEIRTQPRPTGADLEGLEKRLAVVDARIASVEQAIVEADAAVARAAAVPGAIVPPPPPRPRQGPPEEFWVIMGIFMFVVVFPLTIAFARRIWRRGASAVAAIPQEIYDRFSRVDQSLEAIAIEVERIGEGQRFLTRMHAEQQRALGAGAAERLEVAERERERQR